MSWLPTRQMGRHISPYARTSDLKTRMLMYIYGTNLYLIAVHRVIWARVVCWRSCSVSYMQPQGWFEHLNYIGFVVNWGHVRATRLFCMKMLKLNSAVEETSAMRCCPYGLCTHIVDTCISLCPAFYLTCVHLHLVSPECICSQMGEYGPPSAWRATMTLSFNI